MGLFSWLEDKRREKALAEASKAEDLRIKEDMQKIIEAKHDAWAKQEENKIRKQIQITKDIQELQRSIEIKNHLTKKPRARTWSSEHPVVQLHSTRDGDTFRSGYFVIEGETEQDCLELIVPIGEKGKVVFDGNTFSVFCDTAERVVPLLKAVPFDYEDFRSYQYGEAVSEIDVDAAKAALEALGG